MAAGLHKSRQAPGHHLRVAINILVQCFDSTELMHDKSVAVVVECYLREIIKIYRLHPYLSR